MSCTSGTPTGTATRPAGRSDHLGTSGAAPARLVRVTHNETVDVKLPQVALLASPLLGPEVWRSTAARLADRSWYVLMVPPRAAPRPSRSTYATFCPSSRRWRWSRTATPGCTCRPRPRSAGPWQGCTSTRHCPLLPALRRSLLLRCRASCGTWPELTGCYHPGPSGGRPRSWRRCSPTLRPARPWQPNSTASR